MSDLDCLEQCRIGLESCVGVALVILSNPAQVGLEFKCFRIPSLSSPQRGVVAGCNCRRSDPWKPTRNWYCWRSALTTDDFLDGLRLNVFKAARKVESLQRAGRVPNVSSKLGP